jgi:hypothetical protein
MDDELGISFLQIDGEFKENFESKMASINKYFLMSNQTNSSRDFEIINTSLNQTQNIICFARYADNIWYRAKILKRLANQNSV